MTPTSLCAMSVPPQPSSATPSKARPTTDGGAKFGAVPIAAFATMAVVTIAGIVTYVLTKTATVVATCGGDPMAPNQVCDSVKNGVTVGTDTYAEVLAAAHRANQVGQWTGVALVVIGVAFAVMTFLKWRQDIATKAQLTDELGAPISSHSRTTSSSFFGIIFGAGFIALAGYFLLTGMTKDSWGYYLGTAAFGLLGLLFLYLAVPKNGQLLQTFDGGVRVIANDKQHTWAWTDVNYVITPAKGAANHGIGGPGLKQLPITGLQGANELQALVQRKSVEAKFRPAVDAVNRGETVAFGPLGVSREGISHGRKLLPWSEYGGIALHQGNVGVIRTPKGRFAGLSLGVVPNYALFVHLVDAVSKSQPQRPTA